MPSLDCVKDDTNPQKRNPIHNQDYHELLLVMCSVSLDEANECTG